MDTTKRREILSRVASGQLTPEEAVIELGGADDGAAAGRSTITRVRIDRALGSTEVVGDPTVREAVAEGPHQARVDGDALVIEGEHEDGGGFAFVRQRGWNLGAEGDRLVVRMNPALALELDVQAGNCRVRGVEGPIRADVQAGSLKIDGLRGPLEASIQAGSLKAAGVLREGASRISCQAGSVTLHLESGSSVRVMARSTLGKVTLPEPSGIGAGRGAAEAIIGGGQATLQIDSTMGSVAVTAQS